MEKIYMEENKLQKKNKKLSLSMLVCLSIVVFSIFAALCYGIFNLEGKTKESYAVDPVNQFNLIIKGATDTEPPIFINGVAGNVSFPVPQFYANSISDDNKVFCIEHMITPYTSSYSKYAGNDITRDSALLYMLSHWKTIDGSTNVKTWVAQVAIWKYLYDNYFVQANKTTCEELDISQDTVPAICRHYLSDTELNAITTATSVKEGESGTAESCGGLCYNKVTAYINAAKAWQSTGYLKVTTDGNESMSCVNCDNNDNSDDYYSSSLSITMDGAIENYSIAVENLVDSDGKTAVISNDDIVFYDGNTGSQITNLSGLTTNKIEVRIAKNKVPSNYTINFSLKFTGTFDTLEGDYYADAVAPGNNQKVISVVGGTSHQDTIVPLSVVRAPDTGMTTAQTIYFIGLIVLLCGVGIVYANTKTVEIRQ